MSPLQLLTRQTGKRIVSGPEAVRAASKLEQDQERRDQWPYEYLFPPPSADLVHAVGTLAAPAAGTQTCILAYTVPDNMVFVFTGLVQVFIGSGYVPGGKQATWALDVNISVGGTAPPGYTLQGFGNEQLGGSTGTAIPSANIGITIPYGVYVTPGGILPYPFAKPYILRPADILRSKVTTTADISPGQPNNFITVFDGWLLPLP